MSDPYTRAVRAKTRTDELYNVQARYRQLWQGQAAIFYPERADYLEEVPPGIERYDGIYDIEPLLLRQSLGNNLGAMLRPRGTEWFKVVTKDRKLIKQPQVSLWCEGATEVLRNIVYDATAQFTTAMSQSDHDYVTIGNSLVTCTYNKAGDGLIYRCEHMKDVAWGLNDEQVVDQFVVRRYHPVRAMARIFRDRMPRDWKRRLELNPQDIVSLRMFVQPIDEDTYARNEPMRPPRDMKYSVIYIAENVDANECFLAEGTFRHFPALVRRWMTVSNEPYGRSPATSVALADSRTLNVAQKSLLQATEWAVDPPKMVQNDAVTGELRMEAGGHIYIDSEYDYRTGRPIENVEVGDPRYGIDFSARKTMSLGRAFFQNLLKLPDKTMTAYEAGEWIELYVREAAPIFEPMEAENAQLMSTSFDRAAFKGAFEEPPDEIAGVPADFEFETPLSRAFAKLRASQAENLMGKLSMIAQVRPEVLDNIDIDEVVRDLAAGLGPARWIRDPKVRDEVRAQQAQEVAAAQNSMIANEMAGQALRARPENLSIVSQIAENL